MEKRLLHRSKKREWDWKEFPKAVNHFYRINRRQFLISCVASNVAKAKCQNWFAIHFCLPFICMSRLQIFMKCIFGLTTTVSPLCFGSTLLSNLAFLKCLDPFWITCLKLVFGLWLLHIFYCILCNKECQRKVNDTKQYNIFHAPYIIYLPLAQNKYNKFQSFHYKKSIYFYLLVKSFAIKYDCHSYFQSIKW